MVRPFFLLCLFIFSAPIFAATISVKTDRDPVALDETFRIIFTVEGSQDDEPDFGPLNKDFQLLGTSQSSSFSMVDGSINRSKTYTLTVTANRKGRLNIPGVNFGKDKSPPQLITVTAAGQTQPGASPDQGGVSPQVSADQLFMIAEVDSKNAYVQQQVILELKIYRRIDWADASLSEPAFDGVEMLVQKLGKEKNYEATHNGKRYTVTELRYALFPQQSGQLTIQPFRLSARIPTGKKRRGSPFGGMSDRFFDDFFTRPTYAVRSTSSKPITLDIKAIPADFKGQHWLPAKKIQLQETWSSDVEKLVAGEPVTRTIALIADGLGASQLPEIKPADQPGLKNYPDQPSTREQATNDGLLTTMTQKLAIIPSHGGQFSIAAIEIPWWNTRTDEMEIARIPARTLSVSGAAAAASPMTPATAMTGLPAAPSAEPAIQPMPAQQDGVILTRWLIIACAILSLLWLVTLFAWLKARNKVVTPPQPNIKDKARGKQRQALKQLQAACDSKDTAATRDALVAWSRTVWTDNPPANLDEISRRVTPGLSQEINNLAQALYSQKKTDWNAQSIMSQIKAFKSDETSAGQAETQGLEPLYR